MKTVLFTLRSVTKSDMTYREATNIVAPYGALIAICAEGRPPRSHA